MKNVPILEIALKRLVSDEEPPERLKVSDLSPDALEIYRALNRAISQTPDERA